MFHIRITKKKKNIQQQTVVKLMMAVALVYLEQQQISINPTIRIRTFCYSYENFNVFVPFIFPIDSKCCIFELAASKYPNKHWYTLPTQSNNKKPIWTDLSDFIFCVLWCTAFFCCSYRSTSLSPASSSSSLLTPQHQNAEWCGKMNNLTN